MTWNTTGTPSEPERWRWFGIWVRGHIEAEYFDISHTYWHGISLGSSNNTLRSGTFEDVVEQMGFHDGYAVSISSDNNIVEGITVVNGFGGIFLDDGSGNLIRRSRFENLARGIRMGDMGQPTWNTLICNDFRDNTVHVVGQQGGNNIFHHNNFMGQGYAYEEWHNIWHDGYPSGGNYWSDYVGNDSYRGPNQDFPGADGIGDEPYKGIYSFGSENYDDYPFMNPVPKSGCPSPPPQMPKGPIPPYNLSANLENPLHSDVNISWNLSLDDGSPDFQNYAIYYGQDYDSTGASYQFLAEVPSGQNYYVHNGAGYGDALNYFYYVQANDSSGYPAKNDTQVAKFKQNIQSGWNLISVPLQMRDVSIQNVFSTIVVERAMVYEPLLAGGNWREYNIQKPYQTLDSLTITQGVWIQASQDGNMTIAGVVPHFTAMQLEPGWNLVSYASFKDRNVSTTLSIIPYNNVETHIPGSGPYNLVSMNPNDIMIAGRGYWIDIETSCVWIVQN
ncbi:MAG: right-handed parallel beta-helix repeat-containing protein [Methanobacteriota archaeon]|nr:MAG: right-handed parallel beta-helix repeat-containing protein [Euryarchaeota archaeon]